MGVRMRDGGPPVRAAALSREIARLVRLPEIDRRKCELNLVPIGNAPQEFGAVPKSDLDK